jgi:hypothetical protein
VRKKALGWDTVVRLGRQVVAVGFGGNVKWPDHKGDSVSLENEGATAGSKQRKG